MSTLGKKIRKLRMEHALKSKELAALMGVEPGNISRWENDKVTPDADSIRSIENALGVPFGTIIDCQSYNHHHGWAQTPEGRLLCETLERLELDGIRLTLATALLQPQVVKPVESL